LGKEVTWQILLVTGPAGAGKTEAARELAGRQTSPTIHLSLDSFRESVRAGFAEPLLGQTAETARQYALALSACAGVARLYANEGFRCVIDDAIFPDANEAAVRPDSAKLATGCQGVIRLILHYPHWLTGKLHFPNLSYALSHCFLHSSA
jgi:hypothetical protein